MKVFPCGFRMALPAMFLLLCGLWSGCRSGSSEEERDPNQPPPLVADALEPEDVLNLPDRNGLISSFEHLAGWQLESTQGRSLLIKNEGAAIWGRSAAELMHVEATGGSQRVRLVPGDPLVLQSRVNVINLWAYVYPEVQPGEEIRLRWRDREGALFDIRLPVDASISGWQMLHTRIEDRNPLFPLHLDSILWEYPEPAGERRLLLDGLFAYWESLGRINQPVFYERPPGYEPAYAPPRENAVRLDFPTSNPAFLPRQREEKSLLKAERIDADEARLCYESEDLRLEYRLLARPGAPELTLLVNGRRWPGLWRGLRVRSENGDPELRFLRVQENEVIFQYSEGLRFAFRLQGQVLQMDVESLGQSLLGMDLGNLGVSEPLKGQRLEIPFLRLDQGKAWPLLLVEEGNRSYAVSLIPDWWASLASAWVPGETDGSGRIPLGSFEQRSRWRGNRNMFRERLYLSVSTELEHVLPRPAHPQSMYRRDLAPESLSPKVLDEQEPFHPLRVLPRDPDWSDTYLAREEDGSWQRHPAGGYLLKTALLPERMSSGLEAHLDRQEKHLFLSLGDTVQQGPWAFMDMDTRVTGAALFTQTWAEWVAMLQQLAAESGKPLLAPGGNEWLMSGFVDGFTPGPDQELLPLLPHMAWWNIHPVSALYGLKDHEDGLEGEELDRWLALHVAYGSSSLRPPANGGMAERWRVWRVMSMLQRLLRHRRCERIAYWNGDAFIGVAEASLKQPEALNRLYLRLSDGVEIWVNGASNEGWPLRVAGQQFILGPYSFVLRHNDGYLYNGKNEAGDRVSLARDGKRHWIHSPSRPLRYAGMEVQGLLEVDEAEGERPAELRAPKGAWDVWVSARAMGFLPGESLQAKSLDGAKLPGLELSQEDEGWRLRGAALPSRILVSRIPVED